MEVEGKESTPLKFAGSGKLIRTLREHLATKLIVSVGIVLALSFALWTWFNIHQQRRQLTQSLVQDIDRLSTTIKLGTRYAMMLNARPDIAQIVNNISKQKEIRTIRIYNKAGVIKYCNQEAEINRKVEITNAACHVCHKSAPPQQHLPIGQRIRMIKKGNG